MYWLIAVCIMVDHHVHNGAPGHTRTHALIHSNHATQESLPLIKAVVPLQAWSGPEGSRKLRFPDFMTTAPDGGKVVSLTHRPFLNKDIKKPDVCWQGNFTTL